MTKIGFIRHGITDWNAAQRIQGQTDIPLNETGRSQVRALAERLRDEAWDYIYSSDLSRARETAEIIARAIGLSLVLDQRLREMGCGQIEGTTLEERVSRWGDDWRTHSLGIETKESIVSRGLSFVTEIVDRHPDANVLIVSHGAILRQTLLHLLPPAACQERLRNTSVTALTYRQGDWSCELYNCVKHIK
ncbi:histidine phosphatase family protein [Lewinella sp. IMCC34191]|uniref:histidine phosphatase family protein n=1 Tax=Lewinella sp. IMCC34191 TaxID=2259172 RepID=UPI000E220B0C|nr:histidine phosphatase family protein [Lewinella sp. IMCC34191]